MVDRVKFDVAGYVERTKAQPCFICELVRGNPDFAHHVVYEDAEAIVFLNKYPTLRGYTLVSPKSHKEDLADDLTHEEYLRLQSLVQRVARALKRVVPTERVYVLSLGSQQANRHLHWHVAPLPPHLPLERQQFHALMLEHGMLDIPEEEMRSLAVSLANALTEIS
ncbi:MAG TPA: HIT family protein [Rhizomicrobium sp.]|nr:HIT family protein [Rhizomicrobium sp.]